jgi:valyl-tRNA synthetase
LDTWFSSGLWPFSTLGWPESTQDLETFYPTSTLITGFDIIFFWVARMTMMAGYFTKQMPFQTVYIHGLIRDENNQKMSKSKNNGIDPLILIDKYGTDALRYALVREVIGAGQDIRLDYNRKTDESANVEAARNFANKLWNASRFVLMNVSGQIEVGDDCALEFCDRWILSRFHQTALEVNRLMDGYGFGEAARALYEFIWGDFCDNYIELVKSRLQGEDGESKQTAQRVLVSVLDGTLRLLHPFMPHITEEIWQAINSSDHEGSAGYLAIQAYPEGDPNLVNIHLEAQFTLIFETIRTIRNLRAEAEIKPGLQIKAVLQTENEQERQTLLQGETYIKNLAKVADLLICQDLPDNLGQTIAGVVETVQVLIPLSGVVDLTQLKQKLEKNLSRLEGAIASLQGRLNNEGYVKKAPPEVVSTAKAELESSQQQVVILRSRLAELDSES